MFSSRKTNTETILSGKLRNQRDPHLNSGLPPQELFRYSWISMYTQVPKQTVSEAGSFRHSSRFTFICFHHVHCRLKLSLVCAFSKFGLETIPQKQYGKCAWGCDAKVLGEIDIYLISIDTEFNFPCLHRALSLSLSLPTLLSHVSPFPPSPSPFLSSLSRFPFLVPSLLLSPMGRWGGQRESGNGNIGWL